MVHVIGGAVSALLGIIGIIGWWDSFGEFLRGFIPLALFIGGLIAINTGLKFMKGKN